MRIGIPSDTGDPNGPVSPVFGRARYFIIVDVEGNQVTNTSVVENPAYAQRGGAGITSAQVLVNNSVNAVIANSVGPRALSVLSPAGIQLYRAIPGSVMDNVRALLSGSLQSNVPTGPGYGMRGGGFGRGLGQGRGYGRGMGRGAGYGRGMGGW